MGEDEAKKLQAQVDAWVRETTWLGFEQAPASKQNAFLEYSKLLVRIAPNASPVFLL